MARVRMILFLLLQRMLLSRIRQNENAVNRRRPYMGAFQENSIHSSQTPGIIAPESIPLLPKSYRQLLGTHLQYLRLM